MSNGEGEPDPEEFQHIVESYEGALDDTRWTRKSIVEALKKRLGIDDTPKDTKSDPEIGED